MIQLTDEQAAEFRASIEKQMDTFFSDSDGPPVYQCCFCEEASTASLFSSHKPIVHDANCDGVRFLKMLEPENR